MDYDSEDAIFNGRIFKIVTPLLNIAMRYQYTNGCDVNHEISEYRENNCFNPLKCYCFIK